MNFQLLTIILTALYTLAVLFLTAKLLSYDFIITKLIYLGVALLPIFLIIIISLQEYWLILALVAIIPTSKIPLPLLDALSFSYVINAGILFLVIAEITINKRVDKKVFLQFPSKAMAILFFWSLARFIYDRPGAGSTGAVGGLSSALPTVLVGACYFSVLLLALKTEIKKNHIKVLWTCLIILTVEIIYDNIFSYIPLGGFISIFSSPTAWFIALLAITYPLQKAKETNFKNDVFLMLATMLIILLSTISKNRLPLVSMVVALGFAYFLYGVAIKYIRILIPAIIIVYTIAIFAPENIPKSAMRTFSLITPSYFMNNKNITKGLGEIGWQSNWRAELAKIAFMEMKEKPLTGKGFSFSYSELYYNAMIARTGDTALYGGLLSSGGYHNALLFLGVKLGIPITILFIAILLNIYVRFLIFTKRLDNTTIKQFAVLLSSVFVCMLGQLLTNGGPIQLFNTSVMLGIMQGIMLRETKEEKEEIADNNKDESLVDSLMIKNIERKNRLNVHKK